MNDINIFNNSVKYQISPAPQLVLSLFTHKTHQMKGNQELLHVLNSLRADEPIVISQYMVQSEMWAKWGYSKLH